MKTNFIFPGCRLSANKKANYQERPLDCYWIECNWGEGQEIADYGEILLQAIDNPEDYHSYYFLISKDLTRIIQMPWVWHTSAMNCYRKHFIYFESFEFVELNELLDFDYKKRCLVCKDNL